MERISFCQTIGSDLEETTQKLPFGDAFLSALKEKTGFTLPWIPVLYSNKKLALWHGGCAWIYQKEKGGPKGAFFQLRRAFSTQDKAFGYSKEEILIHEAVHAARMEFEEPQFEEFLAYRTSPNRFRRAFGPVFSNAAEAVIFLLSLFVPIVLFFYIPLYYDLIPFALPLLVIFWGLFRLGYRHRILNQCYQKLSGLCASTQRADHLLLLLTDREMKQFSQLPLEKLKALIYAGREATLRQRVLYLMVSV